MDVPVLNSCGTFFTQNVICGLLAYPSGSSFSEMKNVRSLLELLNKNLYFSKIPGDIWDHTKV
jgi:hypothetical protein